MTPGELGRAHAAASRIAQGLPPKVGPEAPDELARVLPILREGFASLVEEREAKASEEGAA